MTTPYQHCRLNLGCGENYQEQYVNVDWNTRAKADVYHDLNVLPYPFPDAFFDEIRAFHVLEHLDKPFLVMQELHRILKPSGRLHLRVPHFSRGFTHAEHCHGFDVSFPQYFDPTFVKSGYFGVTFNLEHMRLSWMSFFHLMPYFKINRFTIRVLQICNLFISWLANLSPLFCSRIWCYWVGGFEEMEFTFRKGEPAEV